MSQARIFKLNFSEEQQQGEEPSLVQRGAPWPKAPTLEQANLKNQNN